MPQKTLNQTEHKNTTLLGTTIQQLDIVHLSVNHDTIGMEAYVRKPMHDTMFQQHDKQHKHHVDEMINTKQSHDKQAV